MSLKKKEDPTPPPKKPSYKTITVGNRVVRARWHTTVLKTDRKQQKVK